MWKLLAIFSAFLLLSASAADIENINDVTLNCDSGDHESKVIVYFSCKLSDVSSQKNQLRVISTDLDVSKVTEKNQVVYVDIVGNVNYPENFPQGLGKSINGTGGFTYKKTPLRYIKRSDFRAMAPSLYLIILEDNKIEEIPFDTFYDLPSLIYLDLRKNRIKSLPWNLFTKALNFTTLIIEGNELSKLHKDLFKNNPKFETLYAEFNQIDEFHEDLMKNNPEMAIISMRHNKISRVPIDFTRFKELDVADFTNNAGTCDTMFFSFKPYDEYYDENEQKKWIKTVPEFQKKIEELC